MEFYREVSKVLQADCIWSIVISIAYINPIV